MFRGIKTAKRQKKIVGVLTQIETPPEQVQGGFGVNGLPVSIFGDPTE